MLNILTLYNPYYNPKVIEEHLELLRENGVVAFGKIKSKLRDYDNQNEQILNELYKGVSTQSPLQLFLSDFNNVYVANVIEVCDTTDVKVPLYYEKLEVEKWFIFDDLRLIVENDFALIRDKVLANFTATNYNGRTFAIYGNKYTYPMQVGMKKPIDYFEKDDEHYKYFTDIFKTPEQLSIKENLVNFCFGVDIFYAFHPNSQDNLINAELEFANNKQNALYDFSSVVMKYSKTIEQELHEFQKVFFNFLFDEEPSLKEFSYQMQGKNYKLESILTHKMNFGSFKYILRQYKVSDVINEYIKDSSLKYFLFNQVHKQLTLLQDIRNSSVHSDTAHLNDVKSLRKIILGIGCGGMLESLIEYKMHLKV